MKLVKKLIFASIFASALSVTAEAQSAKPAEGGPCSNFAKYGAIKLFKANQGKEGDNVSYSGEIDARATLTATQGSELTYSVSIDEAANEGADDFRVSSTFIVKVSLLDTDAKKCKVFSVSEVVNN